MPNRLAQETSPYLLQHQNNPVDWYPWGPEAIEKSRREEKPIFLSIGYSACHWCHVMEHESFEDEEIARKLNDDFVAIKVDREERPDLDQIYMNAVQMLTGHGGWPMSVFLTPDLKPFYGGTYWPPRQSRGMPGFDQILAAVADAWTHRREQALDGAENFTKELQNIGEFAPGEASQLSAKLIDGAVRKLRHAFDATYGGFGQAPKFPHPMDLQLLVRAADREGNSGALDMVRLTLDRMGAGGIYDHLGGGFARYSVDARWLVPHFEKMLYDNALLGAAYVDAYQVTGDPNYSRIARETLDYILRDMTDPRGGFYSTEDADSEGHEGLFYTWTPDEIATVLGAEKGATFARVHDVTPEGNFEEGRSILNLPKTLAQYAAILGRTVEELDEELRESRRALFEAREKRVRPGRDDKVIVAWNGLMIDTMARAGMALGETRYIEAAVKAADFILAELRRKDGRLLHTWRGGQAKLDAYLDDYAALANSLVTLYEASFDERYLAEAKGFLDTVLAKFADADGTGFYYTASDHEELIARTKELTDSSTPSGNALAVTAMLRLGRLLGNGEYLDAAEKLLAATAKLMEKAPLATGQMLLALDRYLGPSYELVLVGEESESRDEAIVELHRRFLPRSVIAARKVGVTGSGGVLESAFVGKNSVEGQPTLYLCQSFACEAPIVGIEAISNRLAKLGGKAS